MDTFVPTFYNTIIKLLIVFYRRSKVSTSVKMLPDVQLLVGMTVGAVVETENEIRQYGSTAVAV